MHEDYIQILSDYILKSLIIYLIPIVVIFVVSIIIYFKKRNFKSLIGNLLLVILVFFIGALQIVPAFIDIKNNSIEQIDYYYAYFSSENQDGEWNSIYITVELYNGNKMDLKASEYFPFEIEKGIIVYAKRSKIILKYTGTVIEE